MFYGKAAHNTRLRLAKDQDRDKYLKSHADSQHETGRADFLTLQEHDFNITLKVEML